MTKKEFESLTNFDQLLITLDIDKISPSELKKYLKVNNKVFKKSEIYLTGFNDVKIYGHEDLIIYLSEISAINMYKTPEKCNSFFLNHDKI